MPTKARKLDARPDTLDFRDRMYEPTLVEVPTHIALEDYRKYKVPILDQGVEGACTGFGLATVAHYLLRRRKVLPDTTAVSARMFYEMAKRYDEWSGEDYDGSSARGAMKGWHKHGVCRDKLWPYLPKKKDVQLTPERIGDACKRPLGAYYRVNHKDLVAMHSALAEVGILFVTAQCHSGWDHVKKDGMIQFEQDALGGHAFAIVAFDERGFWLQNSWGPSWGKNGFGHITYDDWLKNGSDVWVARLGAPVELASATASASSYAAGPHKSEAYTFHELRPHIVSIGNDGRLREGGTYGTSADDVKSIFSETIPAVTKNWKTKRILLYAHGGLVGENPAVQRVADYRSALLDAEVYPLAFIWKTDYWTTMKNMLEDALRQRRPEGFLDAAKDFMLDRLDDALEPIARAMTGKAQWDEMKENARLASMASDGGAKLVTTELKKMAASMKNVEIHIAGHSAGSIFMAYVLDALKKITIRTCTLWAPACTIELFKETYAPLIKNQTIEKFSLFTLTDKAEQDDHCANIYHKSLLYLVSHAFEKRPRIPLFRDGVPILGMEKWIRRDKDMMQWINDDIFDWILSPNANPIGSPAASTSRSHGGFDDDKATLQATLARILGSEFSEASFTLHRSSAGLKDRREGLK